MPFYKFQCKKCGHIEDDYYLPLAEYDKAVKCVCGRKMWKVPMVGPVDFGFKEFTTENINGVPTTVMSTAHRKQLLKKHGLSEAG